MSVDRTSRGGGPVAVIKKNGSYVSARPVLNFIQGTNVTLTIADDPTDNETDITIASTGGGGGSSLITQLNTVPIVATTDTMNFDSTYFDVTESPSGTANVTVDNPALVDLAAQWFATDASTPANVHFHEQTTNGTNRTNLRGLAAQSADINLTLPNEGVDDTLVGKATTDTLTNKSINLANNTLTGTKAQVDTAVSDGNVVWSGDTAGGDLTGTFPNPTIATNAVTYAKMQDVSATNRLLGRATAGAGDPEEITLAADNEISAGALRNAAFTGDITKAAGSNATAVANDAVTFAKMQNIPTDSLVGRDTAGSGDPETILLNASLSMDGSGNLQTAAFTGDIVKAAGSVATTIAADAVDNTKLANMVQSTIKGRAAAAGTGDPTDLTAAQVFTLLGTTPVNIQEFSSSGAATWTKPTTGTPTMTMVVAIGGGGSGGGAQVGAASTIRLGGNGGAPGGAAILLIPTSSLGSTETVAVGAGGASAAGAASGGGTGTDGNAGGATTFGSWLTAGGGGGGFSGGQAFHAGAANAGAGSFIVTIGSVSASNSAGLGQGAGGSGHVGAGGPGACAHSNNANVPGGAGGAGSGGAGGATGSPGTAGGSATFSNGGGGGGGGSSGAAGGAGGAHGAGGGGGGYNTTGAGAGGAGGAGGVGYLIAVTF